jgi:dTDP-4-amino-4,6-dideoxygalactose transaminase
MSIPYLDLHKLQVRFATADKKAFADFLVTGQYIGGKLVEKFEVEFAAYCGVDHAIGTGNGLDALTIILLAEVELRNLPVNARILVPAHTYIATFLSIYNAGLIPVPVDIEELNLSVNAIKNCDQPYDAIVCVDIYGKLVDDDVYAFAKAKNLNIYADTAQSHGAKNKVGQRSGSLARASAFSFYPTKNLGALGDAGAITTNDEQLAAMCRSIANYGRNTRYKNPIKGINSRLDPLQASLLYNRLPALDADNLLRIEIARNYYKKMNNLKISVLSTDFLKYNAMHVFPVFVNDRPRFQEYMLKNGIETSCHYEIPPHQQVAFKEFNALQFPVTEGLHATEISLPCHPLLSEEDQAHIIAVVNNYL